MTNTYDPIFRKLCAGTFQCAEGFLVRYTDAAGWIAEKDGKVIAKNTTRIQTYISGLEALNLPIPDWVDDGKTLRYYVEKS